MLLTLCTIFLKYRSAQSTTTKYLHYTTMHQMFLITDLSLLNSILRGSTHVPHIQFPLLKMGGRIALGLSFAYN
jgi:hypothetical protein